MAERVLTGGCFCGAVRYEVRGEAVNVRVCHCSMCRRLTGQPFFARAVFLAEAVGIEGDPRSFRTSEALERLFCPTCSTVVGARRAAHPQIYAITLGSLDDPNALAPQCHVWTSAKVDWLKLDDGLPQYPEGV